MIFNIQVLRAIASLLVVHAHGAGLSGLRLGWFGGATGVDLFFVISGFIIPYVAHQSADRFMLRRLIRIVPIYWASTLAVYALVVVMPGSFHTVSSSPTLLVRSLLFLPTSSAVHTSDGIPHPTLAGGWTLNYEMYFYVIFWLSLAISKRWASPIAIAILGTVIAIVNLTSLDSWPIAHFYGYPIVLEFAYGVVAFHLVQWLHDRFRDRWPRRLDSLLAALAAAGLACLAFDKELFGAGPRWFFAGLPSFVIVVCAVLLERVHGLKIKNRIAVLIGDASYVLYLLHAYVVFGVMRLVIGNRTFSEVPGQLVVLGLMAVSAVIAIVVYEYFEKPILRRLKAALIPSGRARRASAR